MATKRATLNEKQNAAFAARIEQLNHALATPDTPADLVEGALADSDQRVVVATARALQSMPEHASALAAAFYRLLDSGRTADPNCLAKLAIVEALHAQEHPDPDVFLAGIEAQQIEWTGKSAVDVADSLRAVSALALAVTTLSTEEVVRALTDALFVDSSKAVRGAAARALGSLGGWESIVVLRSRVHVGDDDPSVIGEALAALLAIEPARQIDLAMGVLRSTMPDAFETELAFEVFTALCQCRDPIGVQRVIAEIRRLRESPALRAAAANLVPGVACSRHDAALAFLEDDLCNGTSDDAISTLVSIATSPFRELHADLARTCVESRDDLRLRRLYESRFGPLR